MLAKKNRQYDVVLGEKNAANVGELAQATIACIIKKGFAVVDFKPEEAVLSAARREANSLRTTGSFVAPPTEIVDGLLGEEGSAEIFRIGDSLTSDGADEQFMGLKKVDYLLEELSSHLSGCLGGSPLLKSPALLHVAGQTDEDPPALGDKECDEWIEQLCHPRHFLAAIFLGPGGGTLELQPWQHEEDEAPPFELQMLPGTIVIINASILTHKFFSSRHCMTLTSFLNSGGIDSCLNPDAPNLTPTARNVIQLAIERIKQLKDKELDREVGTPLDIDTPSRWRLTGNLMYHRNNSVAIRSWANRFPFTWEMDLMNALMVQGTDAAIEIPLDRYDYLQDYDPDPESYTKLKVCTKHGSFMDGAELFDNKIFMIPVNEAKGMDPGQKWILETAYDCFFQAGWRRKTLTKQQVGVFCSCGMSSFNFVDLSHIEGIMGTAAANSITANRLSFVLGLQGPNMPIDVGASSNHIGLSQAVDGLRYQTDLYRPHHSAMVMGTTFNFHSRSILYLATSGRLNPQGRCFSFDASANGMVVGEGTAAMWMTKATNVVDGEVVRDDSRPTLAITEGIVCGHEGRTASLATPSGPHEIMLVEQTIRQAGISSSEVELCECHGEGLLLGDATEILTFTKALRGMDSANPLALTAVKTNMCFQTQTCGLAGFFKAILAQNMGLMPPLVHLFELNMHIDESHSEQVNFLTELGTTRNTSSFSSVHARSVGGTMGHAIFWVPLDEQKFGEGVEKRPVMDPLTDIKFWPAGGGQLDRAQQPRSSPKKSYQILGSWSEWSNPTPMTFAGDGLFSYIVTLGVNRFENFVIWMDGDSSEVIHPYKDKAPSGTPVLGPDDIYSLGLGLNSYSWMIDGRLGNASSMKALTDGPSSGAIGRAGDKYEIRLQIAGKWRCLDWKKIEDASGPIEDDGTYYLVGSFNDWQFDHPMTPSATNMGSYSLTVESLEDTVEFQIVRNRDSMQTFMPVRSGSDTKTPILGPTDAGMSCWRVDVQGSTSANKRWGKWALSIHFQRAAEDFGRHKIEWDQK